MTPAWSGRHVHEGRGDVPALLWEGNEPGTDAQMTYKQVLDEVSRLVRPRPGLWLCAGVLRLLWGLPPSRCRAPSTYAQMLRGSGWHNLGESPSDVSCLRSMQAPSQMCSVVLGPCLSGSSRS